MNRFVALLLGGLGLWCVLLTFIVVRNPASPFTSNAGLGEAPRIAFVHGDSIQSNYYFLIEQRKFLFSAVEEAQSTLEIEGDALQLEAKELIEYGNAPSVPKDERQMVQNRLGEIQAQLNQMQESGINQLAELEASLNATAAMQLKAEVMAFASENDIDLILNWGPSGEGILFGSEEWDVTQPFLTFINDRFESEDEKSIISLDTE